MSLVRPEVSKGEPQPKVSLLNRYNILLVDTSVWVAHLRHGTVSLETHMVEVQVFCHPFVIGEIACGNLKNRVEILSLLQALPSALSAEQVEVLQFIETYRLLGRGLG